jgi:hypothetical protein
MSSYPPATVSVSGTNVTASYFLSKPGFVARRLRSLADLRYVGNGLLRGRADAVGGAVGYETTYADEVAVGDWIQRCHGDPGWHLVEDQEDYPGPDGTPWVRLTYRGTAHDWKGTDAIRCARPPADTVAAQEQRWT